MVSLRMGVQMEVPVEGPPHRLGSLVGGGNPKGAPGIEPEWEGK